jgi:signal-transduction protein with cAMP-binding, CBS, and nucleotidyltransferase domain
MANIKKLQVVFPEGKVLFDEGDTSKEMYILLKGEVHILKNDTMLAKINANGSFIGEMATLLNAPRTAKVVTSQKSVFLKVEPEEVDVLFKVTPELGYSLSKSLAERLAIMTEKVSSMATGSVQEEQEDSDKITSKDLTDAEKAVKEGGAPKGPDLAFLTRTEVHKEVFRYWFNHLEHQISVEEIISDLSFPDTLVKLILREYQTAKLIKVTDGVVKINYIDDFQSKAEDWVFKNGLFRSVG